MTTKEEILALANKLNFPALNEWGKDLIEAFYNAARKDLEQEVERLCAQLADQQDSVSIPRYNNDIGELRQQLAEKDAEIERLKLIEDNALKVCGQLDEVVLALPYDYLDPPDGGDVSLGEQVTRMYSEVKALRAKVEGEDELRQQLAAAKFARRQAETDKSDVERTLVAANAEIERLKAQVQSQALEAMINKAGEVMRERSLFVVTQTLTGGLSAYGMATRALPGVKLDDLKGGM